MSATQSLLPHTHHRDDEQPFLADDPSSIRLLTLPEIGPLFDDDLAAKTIAGTTPVPDMDIGEANPAGKPSGTGDAHRGQRPGAARAQETDADGDWARKFASLLTEALSGARPVRQILPCTSERARIQLRALMPLFTGGQRPRLLRVIATRPARDVIEMTVIAGIGARTRALAVRLQRADPAERPAWLNQAESGKQGPVSELPARTAQLAKAAAAATPHWLCTDIEAA